MSSYKKFIQVAVAMEPVHVGSGGARIGRVDLTIVRDPITRIPKIPGSTLAGVYRTYVAMAEHEKNPRREIDGKPWPIYPNCAGLGQSQQEGHCGKPNCRVCTIFGFAKAKDKGEGFAGLAAFSDAHVLLWPVPTRNGPMWVTSPMCLEPLVDHTLEAFNSDAVYLPENPGNQDHGLNLGWILLPVKTWPEPECTLKPLQNYRLPSYIHNNGIALVPDRLLAHVVNSNLEVRTSVSINPWSGAAEEGALFSYEAIPRGSVLWWEIVVKDPALFRVGGEKINIPDGQNGGYGNIHTILKQAHDYFEYLGIGGMTTRGMGRLKVVYSDKSPESTGEQTADASEGSSEQEEAHDTSR